MRIVTDLEELRRVVGQARHLGQRIGFVPTMGNLHEGHYSLLAAARQHADLIIASVFVNPAQFGPSEDFARYPRTPDADIQGLKQHGCNVLFLPATEDIYPFGVEAAVRVSVPVLGDILEGASRPGHFTGVATVVAKLFNLVQPDVAVFGQKDYQQLLVIQRMTGDLAFPIEIIDVPTLREANGLAMSSRNQYLTAGQRSQAGAIYTTLCWVRERIRKGTELLTTIEQTASDHLHQAGLEPDYFLIRDANTLCVPTLNQRIGLVALVAARLGSTRLIDANLIDSELLDKLD